ncbi:Rpn family recombination-promoting nuclease/putative transposase [Sedimentibacter hydroxybenzoicus DSM 7310]|uniref:Rpn family recombination-promoting nuclease/putative transposase n=1 Tax=Sedimentibacter hydroxybenzoicus DSM 7310 TaxID=1123245 RepID=A0A974GWV6_SEDHY|nr:Rpn family recombination-promoting nuclease/putative transposase [Sedimentibacter hydroxybenzoicus]NYB74646.1 Rpn family recombination-promoting nuclease/putative transposase [Sedimentibacter hydroxybenzoicus DSM 7310]
MKIQNPHDKFFKETFGKTVVAKDFINNYLPQEIRDVMNVDTLELQKDSFVNAELEEGFSDILFKSEINSEEGYIYFLFEHKSYPSKDAVFQLLKYMIKIWEEKIKKEERNELPVIIPILIYHGKEKWSSKLRLGEMITGYDLLSEDIKKYIPDYEYLLYNISKYSDEEIKGEAQLRIILTIFRDIFTKDIEEFYRTIVRSAEYLAELDDKQTGIEYFETMMRYIFSTRIDMTERDIDRLINKIGDSYENMRSINQDLTFETASIEFNIRKVPFGIWQYRTLKLINEDGIYTNLAHILSDQCVHTIKAAVFEGTDKAVFKDRQEFSGSLLLQLKEAYDYISRYNRTRSEFSGLHRIDKKDYPEDALRESLLNSLVHRDYSYSASTLISIFDDRIELLSVGGLAKGISLNDIMLGVSVSRNENLANIFYRLTLIEAYGTGIPKIFRSYKDFPIQPKIEVSDNAFKITLPNKNETDEKIFLSKNEKVVMELLNEKYEITRKDVQETLNSSQTMAGRVVKKLTDRGLIKQIGKGKNTRYLR